MIPGSSTTGFKQKSLPLAPRSGFPFLHPMDERLRFVGRLRDGEQMSRLCR
jgi:hypothetical protein